VSANKYQPHVLVLPEDDANRKLANGFLLDTSLNARAIQVLKPAGGWRCVLEAFKTTYRIEMEKYTERYMVLLIDFDENEQRWQKFEAVIPADLTPRVFMVGIWSNPEKLRAPPIHFVLPPTLQPSSRV